MKPGLYYDVAEADYHADTTALSASGAKDLLRSPALFRYRQDNPEHSDAFDYGTAAHALVLGEGLEAVYVAPFDTWQTKAAQEERKIAHAEGLAPILPKQWLQACDMAEALAGHSFAVDLLAGGRSEVSLYAEDAETGIMRRGRIDSLRDNGFVDYKSTRTADPWAFARGSVAQYGYHISEANYRYLCTRNGIAVDWAAFIVQEKDPPYFVEVVELDAAAVERGYELMQRACRLFAHHTASGEWATTTGPYSGRDYTTVSLPRWALWDDEPQQETSDTYDITLESA